MAQDYQKESHSAPEVCHTGHNTDMTDSGNHARKTSGNQDNFSYVTTQNIKPRWLITGGGQLQELKSYWVTVET